LVRAAGTRWRWLLGPEHRRAVGFEGLQTGDQLGDGCLVTGLTAVGPLPVEDAAEIVEQIVGLAGVFDVVDLLLGLVGQLGGLLLGFVEEAHA
jgi:hypothetical protein